MMNNDYFHAESIARDTWRITCSDGGCSSYLLVGDTEGLVIDTGFTVQDLRAFAESLAGRPVNMVASTHGHFDHTAGNGWFPKVFMHAKAVKSGQTPYASLDASHYKTDYPVETVGDGFIIDLGGREIEVLEVPAHSPGSIALLDKRERILFSGDELAEMIPLMYLNVAPPQPYIETHLQNMRKIEKRIDEFSVIWSGHATSPKNADFLYTVIENATRVMNGEEGVPAADVLTDTPADFFLPEPEFKRVATYKDATMLFDLRYLKES